MKTAIVPIGNSKGIRIPKVILEQYHIEKAVDLEIKRNAILIKPFKEEPRKNWELAFKKMHEDKDDGLLIDDKIDIDMKSWER